MTLYDLVYEGDHSELYNMLLNPSTNFETGNYILFPKLSVRIVCYC